MDASALLKSQGWRGSGHSLHKTDDSIGLAKPILTSRKNNTLGIGRKNHVTSDSWWLNAFDEQLKSLDTSNKTSIVQTKTNTKLAGLLTAGSGKYSGANALYACFVSGGLLQGTVQPNAEGESTDATPEAEVARPVRQETKEERRARRKERRRKKAAKSAKPAKPAKPAKAAKPAKESKSASASASGSFKMKAKSMKAQKKAESKKKSGKRNPETKEERRARKEAKRKRRNEEKRRKG